MFLRLIIYEWSLSKSLWSILNCSLETCPDLSCYLYKHIQIVLSQHHTDRQQLESLTIWNWNHKRKTYFWITGSMVAHWYVICFRIWRSLAQTSITTKNWWNKKWCRIFEILNIHHILCVYLYLGTMVSWVYWTLLVKLLVL